MAANIDNSNNATDVETTEDTLLESSPTKSQKSCSESKSQEVEEEKDDSKDEKSTKD